MLRQNMSIPVGYSNGYTCQLRRVKKGLKGGKDRDWGRRTEKQEGGRMKEGRKKESERKMTF